MKDVIEGAYTQKIKDKTEALQNASMKMGEAMYKAQQQSNPNPAGDQPQEEKKEDVVDADYEEVKK